MASQQKQGCTALQRDGPLAAAAARQSDNATEPSSHAGNVTGKRATAARTSGGLPAVKHPTSSDILPPDSTRRGLRVTLDNNSMWNEFFRCKTEMILTKQGSRMFPYCRFRISGLNPTRTYSLVMDVQPLDDSHYKWTGQSWQAAGKAELHVKSRPFTHPESPSTGQHWMQSPVSFYRLKLTNDISDQDGNTVLHPMHRYLPRLHVVQTDKAAKDIELNDPSVVTFTFPQTEFMAVTGYQNSRFTQLKVHYNPFAKGLKEDGSGPWGLQLRPSSGKVTAIEQHPVKKSLKSLLANHKPRSSKAADPPPSSLGDLHTKSSSHRDSSANVSKGGLCRSSHPAQKLFSELIREAHVSLQRCNVEQLGISTEQTNTKEVPQEDAPREQREPSPATSSGTVLKQRNPAEDKHQWGGDDTKSDCSEVGSVAAAAPTLDPPVDSGQTRQPEVSSEVPVKRHRRPAPLPLPALALFLKQHSSKSKKLRSQDDAPTSAPALPADHSSRTAGLFTGLSVGVPQSNGQARGCSNADVELSETSVDDPGLGGGSRCPDAEAPTCLDGGSALCAPTLEFPTSDRPLGSSRTPTSVSSPLTTSSICPTFPPLGSVLLALKPPQAGAMLPSHSPHIKSLLSGPECSSIAFEPLSPANSPEPLSPLPDSLGLEAREGVQLCRTSAASVFKWHTVLPPPETFTDAPFPLASVAPPLLASTCAADPAPVYQDHEQSLPFPAELSPLALHLPLSPTFSSLDGEGLSPTPSLTDLVHFFSTDDDLGMGVEFSHTESVAAFCSAPVTEAAAQDFCQQLQMVPACKTVKRKKKSQRQHPENTAADQKPDDSSYTNMQPNLEEVEEQLFISFTSKEALKLHIADSEEAAAPTPEAPLPSAARTPGEETLGDRISALEMILLRDLKLLKHRQVIHPVLQEVGLKMNLLDPTLAIDLQYLGVRLPIPPPGAAQELPLPQAFVSRTGKTTDVTQIKGWREKFTPSEAPSAPSSANPEAGPSSDQPKKNLSAFCSDMLDEYLEHEGKLIDERAASFSQPQEQPVVYKLPTRSVSYVRTLDSVLKKQPCNSPASDLISGFIPPSKRPKLYLKEQKTSRKGEWKPKGLRQNKANRLKPETNLLSKQPTVLTPMSPITEPQNKRTKVRLNHTESLSLCSQKAAFLKRRRLKPNPLSQTTGPLRASGRPAAALEDMAPLESDSELRATDWGSEPSRKHRGPMMTRALLRQKDLEDGVVWEGRPRTSITEERASVALTSLFTLMGFVCENPTAPIQLTRRRAPPCLNEFCRLGCVCSSLTHCSSVGHCGRPQCMFGCSCLKQKVVLLKNLDSSDSSPSHHQHNKKRRRKRRMKMAYILKEADSVSQPAERVRSIWKKDGEGSDPDPVLVPKPSPRPHFPESRENDGSCARVRGFPGRKITQKKKEATKVGKSKVVRLKSLMHRDSKLKTRPLIYPQAHGAVCSASPRPTPSTPLEPLPKPSKRLIILAECKWESDVDRNHVLKTLCEAMAQDQLSDPFWIKKYLISPLSQTVEEHGTDCCIQYKIHISTPRMEREKPAAPAKTQEQLVQRGSAKPEDAKPPQQLQEEDAKPQPEHARRVEDWKQEVLEEELVEDWQREVVEDETSQPSQGSKKTNEENTRPTDKMNHMGLPFLTGISPAGFLSANKKQPRGTEHLVQVNGKLYPLAKIQLGKMGALHPANRLAAYLTGRVGSNKGKRVSPSALPQSSGLSPLNISSTSSARSSPAPPTTFSPSPQTSGLTRSTSFTGLQVEQLTASDAPEGTGPPLSVRSLTPAATDSSVNMSVVRPLNVTTGSASSKGSQMLMVEVLGSLGKVPVSSPVTPASNPTSSSQRIILKPVHMVSGVQYYRRPDGKLVRLVPVSQLRSEEGQRGPPTRSVTAVKPTLPLTTTTPSSSPSVSGLQSSSAPSSSSPLWPAAGSLPQKGMCTFKIIPPGSNKEPFIITCPKVPSQAPAKVLPVPGSFILLQTPPHPPVTPGKLVSLKPPACGEGGVKSAPVVAPPASLGGLVSAHRNPVTKMQPPPASDRRSPDPEVARGLVDLDIICVDDETMEVVNVGGSSSGETDNSSDFESETDIDKETIKANPRVLHNVLERKRRGQMRQLFEVLKKEVGLSLEKTSKVSTLKKAAEVIEELKATQRHLERKKRRLMKKRDRYLSTIAPASEETRPEICRGQRSRAPLNKSRRPKPGVAADPMEVVDLSHESDELTDNSSEETAACDDQKPVVVQMEELNGRPGMALRRMTNSESNSSDTTRELAANKSVAPETLVMEKDCEETRRLNRQRHADITEISQRSGAASVGGTPPPAGDGTEDDVILASPAAPPVSIITPVQPQVVLQLSHPLLPTPALRDKPRTKPNILCRSKNPAPPSSLVTNTAEGETPSLQALIPTEVLSLVGAAMPGQPILTLSPVMGPPTVLQTPPAPGLSSVTLNLPRLTNRHIRLASLPRPPAATNVTKLLRQPPPPSQVASAGSNSFKDQDQAKSQPDLRSETSLSPLSHLNPGLSKPGQVGGVGGGAVGAEGGGDAESLTSLLDEIGFLNQETVNTATPADWLPEVREEEQDHPLSPWVLQLDSDSDDPVTMVTEEAGITRDQRAMTNRSSKTGVLAPPPLMQMNVGGAKLADPTSTNCLAAGGGVGGGSTEGGVAWRPMPRLVPLGLRGNQAS